MTTVYSDEDKDTGENDLDHKFHLMCKCGHELYLHGNTLRYDRDNNQSYLRVSQCCFCECKGFERVE